MGCSVELALSLVILFVFVGMGLKGWNLFKHLHLIPTGIAGMTVLQNCVVTSGQAFSILRFIANRIVFPFAHGNNKNNHILVINFINQPIPCRTQFNFISTIKSA